ncbi:uncharacterized protein LOC125000002 [Mugil cephalus]|uniref:uncharacterized protein LOC125000002 n=1 Tax=Mugil cephalus TaxID=48193 RepID=UPI001FB65611|nr:uncharacterized protein LOC125000002 [Mugil cephalus]
MLLLLLLLLSWRIITGVVAEDSSVTYYQLRNSSVCLRPRKPPPYISVVWKIGGKVVVSGTGVNPNFAGKAALANHSLCINELMDTGAAIYELSLVDPDFNAVTERHQVIVEEPVPKPEVMITVLHSNLSAGLCSITVNCSIQDDWLWSLCDGESCTDAQKSFSKVNISISTDNSTVVCSGENHVSKNNESKSIQICFTKSNREKQEYEAEPLLYLLICLVLIVFIVIATGAKKLHSTYCQREAERLVLQVIQSQPMGIEQQSGPRDSTSSSSQAEPSYENVDVTQQQQNGLREDLCFMENQVDTLYSILQMPSKTPGHESIQGTLSSASASSDETKSPMQVDTVYSMLQKPNKCGVAAPP